MDTLIDEILAEEEEYYDQEAFDDELDDEFDDESSFTGDDELEIIPPRDSRRQVSRRELKQPPFRYICSLVRKSTGRALGTGTLIGPRTVLTAGHVIDGESATAVRVIPGRRGNEKPPFGTATSTSLKLPSGYRSATQTDYGIVILDRPIGNTSGHWGVAHKRWSWDPRGTSILSGSLPFLPGGFKVNLAGFPRDLPKEKPKPAPCEARTSPARFMYRVYDTTVKRFSSTPPGLLEYVNDTCPGMSGSPVWIKRSRWKGGRVMVAIHIRRDVAATPGLANAGVLIDDDVRRFIRANVK